MLDTQGERAMWRAVILQTIVDAVSNSNNSELMVRRRQARGWLLHNTLDFNIVCALADLCPRQTRAKALKAVAENLRAIAPAGAGKRYAERKTYYEHRKLRNKEILKA